MARIFLLSFKLFISQIKAVSSVQSRQTDEISAGQEHAARSFPSHCHDYFLLISSLRNLTAYDYFQYSIYISVKILPLSLLLYFFLTSDSLSTSYTHSFYSTHDFHLALNQPKEVCKSLCSWLKMSNLPLRHLPLWLQPTVLLCSSLLLLSPYCCSVSLSIARSAGYSTSPISWACNCCSEFIQTALPLFPR